ncbi:9076_t:CDS:2, partial [Scutellospora calospora]
YEIYLDIEWEGGYNYDIKQRLRTFLQRNFENNIGICRKSYNLCKKSLYSITKKKYSKHITKNQVKRSYPVILYHLGTCHEYFKKKGLMLNLFEKSAKLGFKKSIIEIERNTMGIYEKFKDEERFYK